jgi:hypothetical protein
MRSGNDGRGRRPRSDVHVMPDDNWLIPQMLVTDADIALALADIAANHHDPQPVDWAIKNARLTYDYISKRWLSVPMSADYAEALESKLSELKEALVRLGGQF